ncbi:hypothetical protein ABIE52_006828 [Rhodococcus sp. OAS809]|uniref:hypothetical protein n=1 Tax=Rhodococcus sp. OAS809 TaxID=2663874 RepID=UPI001788FEB1
MTAPASPWSDLVAAHLVETVTPTGDNTFVIDCTCSAEVRFTQDQLNAAPVDSTAGALHYMLREHIASALDTTHVVIPQDGSEAWTEFGIERDVLTGGRDVARVMNRNEAANVRIAWAARNPAIVSRAVTASAWVAADVSREDSDPN